MFAGAVFWLRALELSTGGLDSLPVPSSVMLTWGSVKFKSGHQVIHFSSDTRAALVISGTRTHILKDNVGKGG